MSVKFGAWVGDDFYALYHTCGQSVKGIGALVAHERGGSAVDQNGHVFIASKGHIAIDVHGDVGNLAEDVGARTACHLEVAGYVVDFSVQTVEHSGAFRYNVGLLKHHGRIQGQFYNAQIDFHTRSALQTLSRGRIAKGRNGKATRSAGQGHGKIPFRIGGSHGIDAGAVAAIHLHGGNNGTDDGLVGFGVDHLASDGYLGRQPPRTKAQQEGEKEFCVFQIVRI